MRSAPRALDLAPTALRQAERERLGLSHGGALELVSTPEGVLLERRRRATVNVADDGLPLITVEDVGTVTNVESVEAIHQQCDGAMIDTSVMVAGLITNHELHTVARPHVREAARKQVPGIVVAETWAALRRAPWQLDTPTVEEALAPWASEDRIAVTPASAYVEAVRTGRSLNLGGNIHDLLIAMTCAAHGLALATLDRRQAALGRALPGLAVTLLLPDE